MDDVRIAFRSKPSAVVLTSPDEPLPTRKNSPNLPSKAIPAPTAERPATPQPVPVDPWQTEVGRQVRAEESQIRAALAALKSASEEARKLQADRLDEWQRAAVELALTIATRFLHEKIEKDEFPVEAMLREMTDEMIDDVPSVVRLNPADLNLLERRLNGEPLLPGMDDPRLVADSSLARGECRVEGAGGNLRLNDLPLYLQEIREDLLRRMGHAIGS